MPLHDAFHREQGSIKPILVYVYTSDMNDNCCAANFERALFRWEAAVKEFKDWACYKVQVHSIDGEKELKPYELNKKKPALLLLDAEGGLLHKQQLCVDPGKFMKVIKSARRLSDLRFKLKDRHLAKRSKAIDYIEKGSYDRALRILDDLLETPEKLSGHVATLIDEDRTKLTGVAQKQLEEAKSLADNNKLLDSYRLYKEIEKEFSRLNELSREAQEHRRAIAKELRKMGVRIR